MKILYLTDQTYLHGGIEKVLSQKANYLAETAGQKVTICTYNQQSRKPVYTFSKKIRMLDLGVNYVIEQSYFSRINLRKIPYHHRALKKVFQKEQPDIVVSCSFGPDFYFLPFVERQIPKIKEFHTTRYFSSQNKSRKSVALRGLSRAIERAYTQLVILNEDEKQFYPSNNVTIIPNPAETGNARSGLTSKLIIAAGRISYQKNFEDLISAFTLIAKEFPDWQIHIYGDDYLDRQAELQRQIEDLNLKNQILFKGVTMDLKQTFLDYSIYAMTSNYETFPMVLLEALSVGLPAVSYKCPTGPDRILTDHSDGFIVPYKDKNTFATKLKILMEGEDLRSKMGENAIRNVQRFSINKVMQQWISLFEKFTLNIKQ